MTGAFAHHGPDSRSARLPCVQRRPVRRPPSSGPPRRLQGTAMQRDAKNRDDRRPRASVRGGGPPLPLVHKGKDDDGAVRNDFLCVRSNSSAQMLPRFSACAHKHTPPISQEPEGALFFFGPNHRGTLSAAFGTAAIEARREIAPLRPSAATAPNNEMDKTTRKREQDDSHIRTQALPSCRAKEV